MKELFKEALQHLKEIKEIKEKLDNIEDNLMGRELIYQGNYASIIFISSNFKHVSLYVEDENRENWEVYISTEELLELL